MPASKVLVKVSCMLKHWHGRHGLPYVRKLGLLRRLLQLHHHIRTVLEAGLKYLVLTMGAMGCAACWLTSSHGKTYLPSGANSGGRLNSVYDGKERQPHSSWAIAIVYMPVLPATVVNVSGAGDALVAGCVARLLDGASLASAVAFGIVSNSLVHGKSYWHLKPSSGACCSSGNTSHCHN